MLVQPADISSNIVYIPQTLKQPRHQYAWGHYYVSPALQKNAALRNWIESLAFCHLETDSNRLPRYSRKRNQLYLTELPFIPAKLVMKVSAISPQYRLWRRLNLIVTSWLKDYNLNAFYASLGFEACGIDSLQCVAQWNYRPRSGNKKSYLLYHYVDADMTAADLIKQLPEKHPQRNVLIDAVGRRIGQIIQRIHNSGMRHGDPHSGNFLLHLHNKNIDGLTEHDIESIQFTLIDLDKSGFSRTSQATIKRFFDLRCLRRLRIGDKAGVEALAYYPGMASDSGARRIVSFWQAGGFNLYKRLRPGKFH